MKIANGAAKGLEYLHVCADQSVIFREFKASNILLGEGYHAMLSDFGVAKFGPLGDSSHVSTREVGTYGYCAPEYMVTGHLTPKCDVYGFGVVLLELISGRKVFDKTRSPGMRNLVMWVSSSPYDLVSCIVISDLKLSCWCFGRRNLFSRTVTSSIDWSTLYLRGIFQWKGFIRQFLLLLCVCMKMLIEGL